MKIMVIGGGGREHALAWMAARSAGVEEVLVAPGNAGTQSEPGMRNLAVAADDVTALLEAARREQVDLTIVGPEAPLAAGVVDRFEAAGLRCFGPSRAAARLEASKIFCKDFLSRHRIPTAAYGAFDDPAEAEAFIRARGAPIVVKADGLAGGKGVTVAQSVEEAVAVSRRMLSGEAFGAAGRQVLVEECLSGEEASFMAIVDGENVLPLASSQDHKARDAGDIGPNTGGMGAYTPAPIVDAAMHRRIIEEVVRPTVRGMAADGTPYKGFIYAGLMIGADATPRVLEFNCRLGDPETQPILMRFNADLVELCEAALAGALAETEVQWDPRPALGVVIAAGGYPQSYRKGDVITGLDEELADTKVFHAGTRLENGRVLTDGGRVLCVCALGDDIEQAQALAYRRVAQISWKDAFYRSDIGHRAIARRSPRS